MNIFILKNKIYLQSLEVNKFMEFTKVAECVEYCNSNNLAFFRRDLNANFAKILVADTYQNIFDKIKKGENKYYESWSPTQCMKFYIDYEKKVEFIDTTDLKKRLQKMNDQQLSHKNDILNIITHVKTLLPNITGVYILKSIPDVDKKSYHIIFEGMHFSDYRNMKLFVEEQLKPKFRELFDKKIVDTTVYAPKCFRGLLCTKFGQDRPLYLLDTNIFLSELREDILSSEDTTFDHFKKTCITYIEGNSVFYKYKTIDKKKETNKKVHLINDGDIYSDKEIIRKYLDILEPDRFTDRNKWLNIGYILHSINSDFTDLWHYFSSKWDNYTEQECDIAWESFQISSFS